jgi:hypothetical protein
MISWRIENSLLIATTLSALLFVGLPNSAAAADGERTLFAVQRSHDAQRLHEQADALIEQTNTLKSRAQDLLAESLTGQVSVQQQGAQYEQLLNSYHDALNAYLQHRLELQQHVNAFHESNDVEKALNTPVQIAPFKPLAGAVQAQCEGMQLAEKQLTTLEMQLRDLMEYLISQRSATPSPDYTARMNMAQSLVNQHREVLMAFENGLMNKQNLSRNQMHDQIHLAVDAGDYVQSQKIFSAVEQSNQLVHNEAQRAQIHAGLGRLFREKLKILSDSGQLPDQAQATASVDIIPDADVQLEKEYARVQQLYEELQHSHPTTKSPAAK